MSTPNYLANLPTAPRRQALAMLERTRLAEAVEYTSEEHTDARRRVHSLNQQIDATRTARDKLNSHSLLYPPSEEIEEERAQIAEKYAQLIREHRYASAISAAAAVVHESAILERAWNNRPAPAKTDSRLYANVLFPPLGRFVTAPGYTVTVLRPNPEPQGELQDWVHKRLFWQEIYHGTVRRSRARSVLEKWADQDQAYILRDVHGRFYVATPTVRLEFVPTDIAHPHTEGDALRAALAVYGFPAYDDTEGNRSWLTVPLHSHTSHAETHESAHFRISAGERTDRPASQNSERWTVSFYDEDGQHITTLDGSPDGFTLAQDCAYTARAIAEFAPLLAQD